MHLLAQQVAGAELSVPLEHISITGRVHLIVKQTQRREIQRKAPTSRQRRVNSVVDDATRELARGFRRLKSTSKVRRRAAAKNMCLAPQRISDTPRSAPYALAATRFTRSS